MEFYERDEAAIAAENARLEKQAAEWGVDAPILYLRQGITMVRILPQYSDKGVFFHQVFKHRVPLNQQSTWISACPLAMDNTPCPICQMGQEFMDSKDEAKMDFARKNLRPKGHFLYNVFVHSGPADKDGNMPDFGKVYVMESGVMVHKQIISLDQDEAMGWANVTDPQSGVALSIKRTGQGLDTRYTVHPFGGPRTDIFVELTARGIDHSTLSLVDLEKVYTTPSEEQLQEVVSKIQFGSFSGPAPAPAPQFQPTPTAQPVAVPVAPTPTPQPLVPAPTGTTADPLPTPSITTTCVETAPAPVPTAKPIAPPVIPAPPTPEE